MVTELPGKNPSEIALSPVPDTLKQFTTNAARGGRLFDNMGLERALSIGLPLDAQLYPQDRQAVKEGLAVAAAQGILRLDYKNHPQPLSTEEEAAVDKVKAAIHTIIEVASGLSPYADGKIDLSNFKIPFKETPNSFIRTKPNWP